VTANYINTMTDLVKEMNPESLSNAQLAALASLAQQIEWTLQERQRAVDAELAQVEEFEANEFRALAFASDREDFWVDQFWNRFEKVHSKMPDLLIFTDTRFDNEAKSVEHFGGINIEIVKDDIEIDDSHASEQGVSREYIYETIYNDSDLDALKIKASFAYNRWFSDILG
jgi:hypothetical protein